MNKPQTCPLCDFRQNEPSIVAEKVFGGTSQQQFYLCANCNVAYLHPPMTDEEERRFYSLEFEKFMEKRAETDFDWSGPEQHQRTNKKQYQRRLAFFQDLIKVDNHVLEIGCSSGFMLIPLKDAGMNVVGVEPSGSFSNFLRGKGIEVHNDYKTLAPKVGEAAGFDLILHFFVLEHIRKPAEFLVDLLKLLKPGGSMIFEVPSRTDPLVTIYNVPAFHDFYWSVAHHYYFDPLSLRFVLEKTGASFEIVPEQRYDLSNHMVWALEGRPGGQGRYQDMFSDELHTTYLKSMSSTGHADTMVVRVQKGA